jgi:hypothetical protein
VGKLKSDSSWQAHSPALKKVKSNASFDNFDIDFVRDELSHPLFV